ncbi:MAG: bacteriohopanetetrol glucosamine biosynthesis glycosyltransferase HpnI [Bryobacteraceae bacterium]
MIAILFGAIADAAGIYQILAIIAAVRQMRAPSPQAGPTPGVSILKPVRGLDPKFYSAMGSHADQDYPEFELLFGVADLNDPAVQEIERLQRAFPGVPIHLMHCTGTAPNGKVAVLAELERQARFPLRLVNDSDIVVEQGYLRRVLASLNDSRTGLVTCLYRASASHWPGRWEAIGIATDFAPSVLVAPLFGVNEFGLGSTLAFRREQLEQIGGFASIANYIADDYQLGKRISGLGMKVELSREVVETSLSADSWGEVWRHQLRWARTIRVSRGGGYAGLPITNASLWAFAALASGWWWTAAALLSARLAMGLMAGVGVLRCPLTARYWFLIPFRDLWGFGVWAAGLWGHDVVWRDRTLRLNRDGTIQIK